MPKVFRRVNYWVSGLDEKYDRPCGVCGKQPATILVRGWYPSEGPGVAPAVESHYFCAEHEANARATQTEMAERTA